MAEQECEVVLQTGERVHFGQFYERYHCRIQAQAFRVIHCHELAQDIAQDVFLKLWEQRNKLRSVELIEAYLFTMCRNQSLTLLAKSALAKRIQNTIGCECLYPPEENEDNTREDQYILLLNAAIDKLPPGRRLAFRLCKLEGKTYREAAEQLCVSPGTIHDHIVKATRAIRKFLYLCGSFQET